MSDINISTLESSVVDLNSSVRLFLSNLNFDPNEQREIEKSLTIGYVCFVCHTLTTVILSFLYLVVVVYRHSKFFIV
jgi:hypothetical protein